MNTTGEEDVMTTARIEELQVTFCEEVHSRLIGIQNRRARFTKVKNFSIAKDGSFSPMTVVPHAGVEHLFRITGDYNAVVYEIDLQYSLGLFSDASQPICQPISIDELYSKFRSVYPDDRIAEKEMRNLLRHLDQLT